VKKVDVSSALNVRGLVVIEGDAVSLVKNFLKDAKKVEKR